MKHRESALTARIAEQSGLQADREASPLVRPRRMHRTGLKASFPAGSLYSPGGADLLTQSEEFVKNLTYCARIDIIPL